MNQVTVHLAVLDRLGQYGMFGTSKEVEAVFVQDNRNNDIIMRNESHWGGSKSSFVAVWEAEGNKQYKLYVQRKSCMTQGLLMFNANSMFFIHKARVTRRGLYLWLEL